MRLRLRLADRVSSAARTDAKTTAMPLAIAISAFEPQRRSRKPPRKNPAPFGLSFDPVRMATH